MEPPTAIPFFREAGDGPGVVCIHANASSSSQWRDLMDRLAPSFHVLAPDLYGSGKSPFWDSDRRPTLRDEAAFLDPVFEKAGVPFTLVGHSYGGATALIAALEYPRRVRALALYEPTLFSLVEADSPPPNEAEGIREVVNSSIAALTKGDADRASQCFIDYWMGEGAWASMPESRRVGINATIVNIEKWGHALITEPTPLEAFKNLRVPVLYMVGNASPISSRAVARLLTGALPQVQVVELEGIGHMGPVTHPERINQCIEQFLHDL